MTGVFEVNSVEETWELARKLAPELKPGDVICLEGDLGAGKTTFTQGLAAALGVPGRVNSPTFCIVQEHRATFARSKAVVKGQTKEGEIPLSDLEPLTSDLPLPYLVHMDLYRLHDEDDVIAVGWEDFLAQGAILVVEWPERAGTLIPSDAKHVIFTHLDGEEARRIEFR